MTDLPFPDVPFVQSVLHPSDFSPASKNAFANALAIALRRRTRLSLFHVVGKDGAPPEIDRARELARETLAR